MHCYECDRALLPGGACIWYLQPPAAKETHGVIYLCKRHWNAAQKRHTKNLHAAQCLAVLKTSIWMDSRKAAMVAP